MQTHDILSYNKGVNYIIYYLIYHFAILSNPLKVGLIVPGSLGVNSRLENSCFSEQNVHDHEQGMYSKL